MICIDGLARGGPQEARNRLADFWRAVSIDGKLPAIQRQIVERVLSFMPLDGSPVQAWLNVMSRYFSPYDLNPLNINPLKEVIDRFVDFEAVRNAAERSASRGEARRRLSEVNGDRRHRLLRRGSRILHPR